MDEYIIEWMNEWIMNNNSYLENAELHSISSSQLTMTWFLSISLNTDEFSIGIKKT